MNAFGLLLERELKIAFRRWGELLNPLLFFVIVTTLFPLALEPEPELLRSIAAGVVWVAALLSGLLSLEHFVRNDFEDGSLEQLALSGQPLSLLMLAKVAGHWLVSGLPLVLLAPVVAYALKLPAEANGTLMLALLLGTPTLSLVGAVGAALTVSLKRGGVLLSLLFLPLAVPVLILGARTTDLAADGLLVTGPLYLLAALLVVGVTLTPFAVAAAVRISLD